MPSSEPRPELVMSSSTGMVIADHSKPRTACCDHSGSSRMGNIVAFGLALAMGVPNHLDVGDGNESLVDHHLQDWQELLDLGFFLDDGLVQRLAVPAVVLAEVDPNHLGAAVQPHELSSLAAAPGSSRCVYLM